MSSAQPTNKTHVFNGDTNAADLVDAAQLDTQLSRAFAQGNGIIASLDRITDANDRLAAKTVGLLQLKPEVLSALEGLPTPLAGVKTVATANITLSGLQSLNGYLTIAGDRVLCVGQTDQRENGLWVAAAGAWARPSDFPAAGEPEQYTNVEVLASSLLGAVYALNTASVVIDTTDQAWIQIGARNAGTTEWLLSNYSSLAAALSSIGATVGTLVIDATATLTGNTVIPATLSVRPTRGGSFVVGTHTLTLTGAVVGDPQHQIFDVSGGGAISFADATTVRLSWWASLDAFLDSIGSSAVRLLLDVNATLSEPETIPTTVEVEPIYPAAFATGAHALTLNGRIVGDPQHQIFDVSGGGSVVLTDTINVRWFGAVGDASTDDTTALQAALDSAQSNLQTIRFPDGMACRITGALTHTYGVIVMEGGSYLQPTGSGYTALSLSAVFHTAGWTIRVYGSSFTGKGLYWDTPAGNQISLLRCTGCGAGIHVQQMWDCAVDVLSTEDCGSATEWSIQIEGKGGTQSSNETFIQRIQCERATERGVYIGDGAGTLPVNFVVGLIHAEQSTNTPATTPLHYFAGNVTIQSARFDMDAGTGRVDVYGPVTLMNIADSGEIAWYVSGFSETRCTIVASDLATLNMMDYAGNDNQGSYQIEGGAITTFNDRTRVSSKGTITGCRVGTLLLKDRGVLTDADECNFWFISCQIGALNQDSANGTGNFRGCVIQAITAFPFGSRFFECTIVPDLTVTSIATEFRHCHFLGDLKGSTADIYLHGCEIDGDMDWIAGAFNGRSLDTFCRGTVNSSWAVPPAGGAHVRGERHENLLPTVGQPKAWICTAAGTPGTWTSEGNL